MKTENEINTALPEKTNELPEHLSELPSIAIEMPDLTPPEKISEITDENPDDYTESLNSLVTKYAKSAI